MRFCSHSLGANARRAAMPSKLLPKHVWKNARGALQKAKRLQFVPDSNGLFMYPVENCDSEFYRRQRGCRKHVYQRHGWFYYFNSKLKLETALPEHCTKIQPMQRTKRFINVLLFH